MTPTSGIYIIVTLTRACMAIVVAVVGVKGEGKLRLGMGKPKGNK